MSGHTPEPWMAENRLGRYGCDIVDGEGSMVADAPYTADAHRIVSCVNACAGLADPAATLKAAREALDAVLADTVSVDYLSGRTLIDADAIERCREARKMLGGEA